MPFPIEDKLVIAVSSSALFDLSIPDKVFKEQGPGAYKAFQEQHLDEVLGKGVAFPFVNDRSARLSLESRVRSGYYPGRFYDR